MPRRKRPRAAKLTPAMAIRARIREAARAYTQQVLHMLGSATLAELGSLRQHSAKAPRSNPR